MAAGVAATALAATASAAVASGSGEADPQNKSPSPVPSASPGGEKLKQQTRALKKQEQKARVTAPDMDLRFSTKNVEKSIGVPLANVDMF